MLIRGTAAITCVARVGACNLIDRSDRPDDVPAGRAPTRTVKLAAEDGNPLLARSGGDTVVLMTSEALIGLDRRTGDRRWRTVPIQPTDREIQADDDIVVTGDSVVVMVHGNPIEAPVAATVYDLATGKLRFTAGGKDDSAFHQAVGVSGELLVHSRCTLKEGLCQLSAYELSSGDGRWRQIVPGGLRTMVPATFAGSLRLSGGGLLDGPLESRGDLVGASPAAADYVLVNGSFRDAAGTLRQGFTAVSVATGQPAGQWIGDTRLSGTPYGRLLLQVGCSKLAALEPTTGRPVWSMDTSCGSAFRTTGSSGVMFGVTPALVDGSLLVMSKEAAQVVDPASGAVRWSGGTDVALLGLAGGTLVTATKDLDLVGVEVAGGAEKWRITTPKDTSREVPYWLERYGVGGGTLVYDGREMIRKGSPHVLRAVDLATGKERWFARDRALIGLGEGWVLTAKVDRLDQIPKQAELGFYAG